MEVQCGLGWHCGSWEGENVGTGAKDAAEREAGQTGGRGRCGPVRPCMNGKEKDRYKQWEVPQRSHVCVLVLHGLPTAMRWRWVGFSRCCQQGAGFGGNC